MPGVYIDFRQWGSELSGAPFGDLGFWLDVEVAVRQFLHEFGHASIWLQQFIKTLLANGALVARSQID